MQKDERVSEMDERRSTSPITHVDHNGTNQSGRTPAVHPTYHTTLDDGPCQLLAAWSGVAGDVESVVTPTGAVVEMDCGTGGLLGADIISGGALGELN
jgi:hypothetical protein